MTGRAVKPAALAALLAAGLAAALPALGFWSGTVSGSGRATGGTLPAGEAPTATAAGADVAVSWRQSAIPGLGPVGTLVGGGYVLNRYAEGSSSPVSPGLACGGVKAGAADPLSCTELGVPEGRWQYAVSTRLHGWTGAEGPRSAAVVVDLTPPRTTVVAAPPANAAGWNATNVILTLAADDGTAGSGVASLSYGATGAQSIPQATYGGPFAVGAEGVTTVSYAATDVAGNVEPPKTTDVRIDRMAPTASLTAPPAGADLTGTATVAAGAADALSGMALVRFGLRPAGGAWTEVGAAAAAPYAAALDTLPFPDGAYELRAVAEDRAGNQGESLPVGVVIDNLVPSGLDVQGANGGLAGRLDAGDAVTFTFSEPMLPSSLRAGWDGAPAAVSVDVRNGPADRLEVVGVALGRVTLGASGVVSGPVVFAGTLSRVAPAVFRLVLGACMSSCTRLGSGIGATTYAWQPSSRATDLAGNGSSTAQVTQAGGPKQNL